VTDRLETLHVAALPYPTSQGTQAAVGSMVAALAQAGRASALLTYRAGVGEESRFAHLVPRGVVRPTSMRSGPSLAKLAADVELGAALARHARSADVVFAHHVEAALLARALGLPAYVFVAHTDLGPELPTYFTPALAPIAARAGRALDRSIARAAPALAAISPKVARALESMSHREVVVLPVPISRIHETIERSAARRALELSADERVVLYAGNLDAYQGLEVLVAAMRGARATLLVATESDVAPLRRQLDRAGVRHRAAPLATEEHRARAHAAADVTAVPRLSPGGLPIKLLDALARGVPVVAMERALAGFELHAACLVTNDAAEALGAGITEALSMRGDARAEQIARGHAYLEKHHGPVSFLSAVDRVVRAAAR
jgi:glycosyltransferase involved in cell wall biosynthesis